MTEHPILFSAPMVRAILEDRKGQTRRVVTPTPVDMVQFIGRDNLPTGEYGWCSHERVISKHIRCPYGVPGDRLWVRETWKEGESGVYYRADNHIDVPGWPWRPSIFMPRWASRITLEVTDVRVQRVQDISECDAKSEGVGERERYRLRGDNTCINCGQHENRHVGVVRVCFGKSSLFDGGTYRGGFSILWDSINAKRGYGWSVNPWVWAITFRRLEGAR